MFLGKEPNVPFFIALLSLERSSLIIQKTPCSILRRAFYYKD
jgi:hypothetical protein